MLYKSKILTINNILNNLCVFYERQCIKNVYKLPSMMMKVSVVRCMGFKYGNEESGADERWKASVPSGTSSENRVKGTLIR